MGLDMYLRAERYLSGYTYAGKEEDEKNEYAALVAQFGAETLVTDDAPSAYVKFTVAYWRKANAIHQWFVENVQGGEDECKPHYVDRAQLRDLRDTCAKLLRDRNLVTAEHTLPPASGFFFGSVEIDDWYWHGIESTVEQLDRVLAAPEGWSFEYQSSW